MSLDLSNYHGKITISGIWHAGEIYELVHIKEVI